MQVSTSHGIEAIDFNKILTKITSLSTDLSSLIDPSLVAQKTIQNMVDGISTQEIDYLSSRIAANMVNVHYDYSILGARIFMTRLHKNLDIPNRTFAQNVTIHYNHKINGQKSTRISKDVYDFIQKHADRLESMLRYDLDFLDYDYQAIKTMQKRSLETIDGETAETPAQAFLKVAVGLNIYRSRDPRELDAFEKYAGFRPEFKYLRDLSDEQRLENIQAYYEALVNRHLSPQGPILMHAGSDYNQMSSCYLGYVADSLTGDDYHIDGRIDGILKSVSQLAAQSKGGGGNAMALHDLRAAGSSIRKTNGKSNGILPFMKMYDATIGAIDQSGRRAGTCAVYLEPWHADILTFLDAANHFTIEEKRCKNLFYALWVNDVFFERLVRDKGQAKWTLFDPFEVLNHIEKPLSEYYGEEFKEKYEYLESLGVGREIPLMEIWARVCELFQTVGNPYIVNKDEMNKKSNEKNLGVIKSSNLCTEIALVSNNDETAVCVLSTVVLSRMDNSKSIDGVDYDRIIEVSRQAVRHMNNVIDLQFYPTPETRNACLKRRSVGLGAQGLADLFLKLKLAFTSPEAMEINKRIYECIYFGALIESMELAKVDGAYTGFKGSPASKGVLQYDMWDVTQDSLFLNNAGAKLESIKAYLGNGEDVWAKLKADIQKYGLRNSEVTALAPTASSAIRMSNNDMHEPYTRNIYVKGNMAGSQRIVNRFLQQELSTIGMWNKDIFTQIVNADGSIKDIQNLPQEIKERFATVYELDWKKLIDMQADRSPFVSQTSSFNHYTSYQESGPTAFTQRIIYAWRKRLKTLSYYMHTEAASTAKKELGGVGDGWDKLEEIELKN